ncbi:MAG: pyruvate formate lyase family protein, partial [Gammaproteobacteria bacterium]|nr:pyruvate formate lyase family protein [Gammaproteobacteria bacterium]
MNDMHLTDGGIKVNLASTTATVGRADTRNFPIENDKPNQVKTLDDLALGFISLDAFPVVKWWRERLFSKEGTPEICDELPRLLTEFLRSPEAQIMTPYTRRAKALNYIFSNKTPLVRDTDLLPGQTTTSFVGPVVYADTIGYCIWPELKTVATRKQNPFKIKKEVADRLSKEIFPF